MLYLYSLYIFQCENIVSLFISCEAFGDAWFLMSKTMSHTFFFQ